jgi:hypothetical protein
LLQIEQRIDAINISMDFVLKITGHTYIRTKIKLETSSGLQLGFSPQNMYVHVYALQKYRSMPLLIFLDTKTMHFQLIKQNRIVMNSLNTLYVCT